MDGYPAGSLDHNVPLLVASGLSSKPPVLELEGELKDQGILIESELPPLDNKEAEVMGAYLEELDAQGASWTSMSREEPYRFRIKAVGRSFLLPSRRARLPDSMGLLESTPTLHSPFSPLSPVSALYPDGLINSQWIKKHQELVPCIYACFYTLGNDKRLRADINKIKGALARSGYKTRVAVILLGEAGDGSPHVSDAVLERLETIRRGTALDPKSIFYITPRETAAGLRQAVDTVLSALYTTAVEYYRDLGRHARKKRSRGAAPQPTVPPTLGTSRTLQLPDWNLRYDFKAAVLAEFRQEMDAVIRSFEQAYEVLLGPDVLDIMPSWSPRWNEARLLSDVISIRCLRNLLWMGHTSLAVRRWQMHRDRIADFVNGRGHGTNNYGWAAWEARWAVVMASLMEKVSVPGLVPATMTLFLQPEKAVLGERMKPWELLHHPGYWYRMAARHLAARRALAHSMPEEDRRAPDGSAPKGASKAYTYDTYMCPEPHEEYPLAGDGVNHACLIIDCLVAARAQFRARRQLRAAAEMSLECAREMASLESWDEAMAMLRPLWDSMTFRSEGWVDAAEELCWLVRRAAVATGQADLVVAVDWELMHSKFSQRPHWHYDLGKSLDGMSAEAKPVVSLSDESSSSFVSGGFAFRTKESRAGETCKAQLVLDSEALAGSAPVAFSSVRVEFEGSLRPIIIEHDAPDAATESSEHDGGFSVLALKEEFAKDSEDELPSQLRGRCNLALRAGQRRVLEMGIPLREAGGAEASRVTLSCRNEAFDLDYTLRFRETDAAVRWYVAGSGKPRQVRPGARSLHIQPRPPKMKMRVVEQVAQYYTNETVELRVELVNDEDEAAGIKLDVQVFGQRQAPGFRVSIRGEEHRAAGGQDEARIAGMAVGSMKDGLSLSLGICIDAADGPTTHEVLLRAAYHVESDAATPMTQTLAVQVDVVTPFEANYALVPRLHPDAWPSLFDDEGLGAAGEAEAAAAAAAADSAASASPAAADPQAARGLAQKWCLVCHYASFALEELDVLALDLAVLSCGGGARCDVVQRPEVRPGGIVAAPQTMGEARFELVAQKRSLDDRRPATLELAFAIGWRRRGAAAGSPVNTTRLAAGSFPVLATEPRVLASARRERRGPWPRPVLLDVTIENPSSHFLTFGLAMEASDAFALSGARQTTVHLLPLSRRTARFRLLPLVRGAALRPGLVVRDKYFQKMLRILPTDGVAADKDGLLWVPADADVDADADG